jgi:hypothetical protein
MQRNGSSVFFIPYSTWYPICGLKFLLRKHISSFEAYTEQEASWKAKKQIKNKNKWMRIEFGKPIIDIEFLAIVSKLKIRKKLCQ